MPEILDFQHPRLVPAPPEGLGWVHGIKFDGYRLEVRIAGGAVTVWTRNGHDWTDRFPGIVAEASLLPDCILDGELVALNLKGQQRPLLTSMCHPTLFRHETYWLT